MRLKVTKTGLSLLLLLVLCGMPLWALATSHGDTHAVGESHALVTPPPAHGEADVHASSAGGHGDAHGVTVDAAHGEAAGAHGSAHGGSSLTPKKLKDLFWRTVNFAALLVILIYFGAKPIGSALSGRRQGIIEELEALEAKRDAAERSYKEFESKLAGMEKEMGTVVERAVAQAEAEKVKILEDAEKAAEDIKRQAEASIQAEIVEAKRSLRDEVADQAAAMAEELIVKNLTPEDQVKITEQYLDRVGAVQ